MLRQRRFAILKSYYDFGTFVSLNREEGSATCCIPGAKEVPKCKECNLLLVFTKRLCNIFSDELDRFPKSAGFLGGKHVPTLLEASNYSVSHPLERHWICALKT